MSKISPLVAALVGLSLGFAFAAAVFTVSDGSGEIIDRLTHDATVQSNRAQVLKAALDQSKQKVESLTAEIKSLTAASAKAAAPKYKVIGVKDGDTIEVLRDNRSVTVRLDGIDAPEIGQPFGRNAKSRLSQLCFNENCELIESGRDKYGRTLATVTVFDRSMNLRLVSEGLAWHYKKYSDDPALAAAETAARKAKSGLWKEGKPIPPWEWRNMPAQEKTLAATGRTAPRVAPNRITFSTPDPEPKVKLTHWLNTSSGVRHNASCRWYGATKGGRRCSASEGRACGQCGG